MALTVPFQDLLEMDCGQNTAGQAAKPQFSKEGNPSSESFFKSSACYILAV